MLTDTFICYKTNPYTECILTGTGGRCLYSFIRCLNRFIIGGEGRVRILFYYINSI